MENTADAANFCIFRPLKKHLLKTFKFGKTKGDGGYLADFIYWRICKCKYLSVSAKRRRLSLCLCFTCKRLNVKQREWIASLTLAMTEKKEGRNDILSLLRHCKEA
jgi:hypothetical protein